MTQVAAEVEQTGEQRFMPYPEYKDSGVEWLGDIPDHWEAKRLKTLLSRNDSGVWGEEPIDGGVVVLRSTEQTLNGQWRIEEPARRSLLAREVAQGKLAEGDLVVTKSSGSNLHIGKTSIVDAEIASMDCCFSNFMQRLRIKTSHHPRFFWYFLNSQPGRMQLVFLSSTTTGLGNLNGSILGNVGVPVPTETEQQAIAGFLDREMARIDALIQKKERLIELLQEKRTALISHSVTNGLNPTAPMKDSGVEWLGEIPAHWEVEPLFTLMRERQERNPSKGDEVVLSLSYGRLVPRDVSSNFGLMPASFETYQYLEPGDIALRLTDLQNDKTSLRVGRANQAGIITSAYTALRSMAAIDAAYAFYVLNAYDLMKVFYNFGAGVRQTMDYSDLKWFPIVLPIREEQRAIAAFLDRETAKIDALLAKMEEGIERLKEYRRALISAAVAGKIDVRERA